MEGRISLNQSFEESLNAYIDDNDADHGLSGTEHILIGTKPESQFIEHDGDYTHLGGGGTMNARDFRVDSEGNHSLGDTIMVNFDKDQQGDTILTQLLPSASEIFETPDGEMVKKTGTLSIYGMSLSQLRDFPEYLSDAVLQPNRILIPTDHHLFWSWTAGFANFYFDSQELKPIQQDFNTTVHMMTLPLRQYLMDDRVEDFIYDMNQDVEGIQQYWGLKFATSIGFSVLEGLVRRRCEQLEDDGKIKEGSGTLEVPTRHIRHDDRNNCATLYEALWIWKEEQSDISPHVKSTLDHIDDLDNYDVDCLTNKFRGLEREELEKYDSILWGLYSQRNRNLHGEDSTMAIGAVVLNLCCLVLWDTVEDSEFEEKRRELLSQYDKPLTIPQVSQKYRVS